MALKFTREQLLATPIQHIDIKRHNVAAFVEAMRPMSYSARDLARAADIYERMVSDKECGVILCLAGSLINAGLKHVFLDLLRSNLVDAIVSTGANIVDQDFFEGMGFRHYVAPEVLKSGLYDEELRELRIDRIYDTLISEDDLRLCDDAIRRIADSLDPGPYSSRQFIRHMGAWLQEKHADAQSIVLEAYRRDVPIFCPAFSDCSAGFGLVAHQHERGGESCVTIDSARDFYELTQIKLRSKETGLFMIGGGVPKNFAQDVVVAAEMLGESVPMHRYAVQITVADVRDGALSSSTLKEAHSWGKVDTAYEQMVYSEATLAVPLIAGCVWHREAWKGREPRRWNRLFERSRVAS
jgi:deoxyhypusine synthase